MPTTAAIECYCPPMAIHTVSRKLRRTAEEPMVVTVTFANGRQIVIEPVIIPPTDVARKIRPLQIKSGQLPVATVSACVGDGGNAEGRIVVKLPKEPVVLDLAKMVTIALAIDAPTTLTLASGEVWKGSLRFPDCPTSGIFGDLVAEAVTAVGTLTLVEPPQAKRKR